MINAPRVVKLKAADAGDHAKAATSEITAMALLAIPERSPMSAKGDGVVSKLVTTPAVRALSAAVQNLSRSDSPTFSFLLIWSFLKNKTGCKT